MTTSSGFRPGRVTCLGVGAFLVGLVLISPFSASAAVRADSSKASDLTAIEAKIRIQDTADGDPALPFAREITPGAKSPSLRKRKKRRWFMPASVARNKARSFARYVGNQSYPEDYSDDPDLIGSVWETFSTGSCKRRGFSRVNCFWAVFSEPFDLIDEFDNVVGEDEFFCAGFLDVWYPRAVRRAVKIRNTSSLCDWNSNI